MNTQLSPLQQSAEVAQLPSFGVQIEHAPAMHAPVQQLSSLVQAARAGLQHLPAVQATELQHSRADPQGMPDSAQQ